MNQRATPVTESKRVAVSVIIPCFRCSETIGRAVDSILNQTVRPSEIILVDDASGDGTLEVLKNLVAEHPDLIKLIAFDENQGVADARNSGWAAATQPYIAFLDADDAWHPRKIEIQYDFMLAHPDVVLSGHKHRQINPDQGLPSWDIDDVKAWLVTKMDILLSNRFITPSVMLKRDIPFRFAEGKRHMEDHLLWSQIICTGLPVAKLSVKLAAIYKFAYGAAGLSAQGSQMHRGEIKNFRVLREEGAIGSFMALFLTMFSHLKNVRRILVIGGRKLTGPTSWQVISYMTLTYSLSGLLVVLGAIGRHEMAADVAIVQGAVLATFYMLSGDARHLILADKMEARHIIFFRLACVVPLAIVSYFMSVTLGRADAVIACVLILRRSMEWLAEVHVTEIEREQFMWRGLLWQPLLFLLAITQIVFFEGFEFLWLWAVSPIVFSLKFLTEARYHRYRLSGNVHIASTAIMGLANYALRIMVVALAGKVFTGMLFSAIAIGSFAGTMFANVVGPTLVRKNMVESLYIRAGLLVWFLAGTAIYINAHTPFQQTLGLSIIGGAVMVLAQHARLLLLKSRHTFWQDSLIHVLLVGLVPLIYHFAGLQWLTSIYLVNALLAWIFYNGSKKNNEN